MKLDLEFRNVMPSNVTPLESVAMVKCLDENGEVTWFLMLTENLNLMESYGMLMSATILSEDSVREGFRPHSDD